MKHRLLGAACGLLFNSCTLLFLGADRCGDAVLSEASEACDDGNRVSGDGCSDLCRIEAECGDGIAEGGEECDDGNANNTDDCLDTCLNAFCGDGFVESGVETCDPPGANGCDATCQREGTLVDCAVSANDLSTAITNAASGDTLNVTNGNLCTFESFTFITNKTLSIIGDGQPVRINNAIEIDGSSNVVIKNATIEANANNELLHITDSASLGLIQSTVRNLASNAVSRAILCDNNAKILIDSSNIKENQGEITFQLSGSCQSIISNSTFTNNQNEKDLILAEDSSKLNLVFSTFFNNLSAEQGIVDLRNGAVECRIDSIIGENVGPDPVRKSAGAALISSAFSFVQNETEFGISNISPTLDAALRITNAAVLGQGNPTPDAASLFFDPATIVPGIDLFNHDLNNNPRPQGARDPGAVEAP